MVDGIIQEVFKSHTDRLKIYEGMLVYTPTDCSLLIKMLEQELIEKIKQYELLCYKDNGQPTTYIPKVSLIGDNQE